MARQPRLDLPGIPQHIVQRGNNRLPCFLEDDDRRRYRTLLREALQATGCTLHAYVLMDNHVHLLITPPESGLISRLMQKLGASMLASSMHVTDEPARCGKAAINLAWSTAGTICCGAIGTSISIRYAPE